MAQQTPKTNSSPSVATGGYDVVARNVSEKATLCSYHFVGIGGCGMSALAQLLHRRGHRVSGSDQQASDVTETLVKSGIEVYADHSPEHFKNEPDVMVFSAAVGPDNPEWRYATQRSISMLKYAQLLGQLSRQIPTLAVAGTHGKSTTSGWLAYTLSLAGVDPSYVIGAGVNQLGGASGVGQGPWLVVEACEYDRSFLNLAPAAAAILNVEADHLDYYRNLEEIVGAFGEFAGSMKNNGYLILNDRLSESRSLAEKVAAETERFNLNGTAEWTVGNLVFHGGHGQFDLLHRGENLGRVTLSLAGEHNVENALAVAALAHRAGLNTKQIIAGLETFEGVNRRMSFKGCVGEITVLDDYAHHPTEIRTTLAAIAAKYRPERLWCVFQPHQHSRTRFLLDDFALSFAAADVICLPDIYFVRDSEQSRRDMTAETLAERIAKNGGNCHYLGSFERILDKLTEETRPGDLVVTMGAGTIWKVADEFICRLGRNR